MSCSVQKMAKLSRTNYLLARTALGSMSYEQTTKQVSILMLLCHNIISI